MLRVAADDLVEGLEGMPAGHPAGRAERRRG